MKPTPRLAAIVFVLSLITLPLIALPLGGANAQDIRVENYKKTVDNLVARWAAAEIKLAQQLSPILNDLDGLARSINMELEIVWAGAGELTPGHAGQSGADAG